MFWLAGLMGLIAAGAATFVDFGLTSGDDVEAEEMPEDTVNSGDGFTSGTPDGDLISGSGDQDQIGGYDGHDTLAGGDGNDSLHGMDGDDELFGDADDDTLHGEDGADTLVGGAGNDALFGHNDADLLQGEDGADTAQGGAGNDRLEGGVGNDALSGGLDDDTLVGGSGADTLFGGWGADVLIGVEDDPESPLLVDEDEGDFLNGGGGDDLIIAGNDDIVTTGDGADDIVVGDWIADGRGATITDFDPDHDNLVLVYDDSVHETVPEVTLMPDPDAADTMHVLMDGAHIAQIANAGALTADRFAVMSLSLAQSLGFAPP